MKALTVLSMITLPVMALDKSVPLPAFPGAEGAGMYTTGGRGGSVVHVTSLEPEGPGSLAEAVSQPNRIVVFDVSGIIDLTGGKHDKPKGGRLAIDQPNITIAGQTAPGEGICLKGGALQISASNIIVRHLRSRRGFIRDTDSGDAIEVKPATTGELTAASGESAAAFEKRQKKKAGRDKTMKTFAPLADIMLDHCSASWATDENFTLTHADRTTMQYGIASEGLDYTNSKQTPPNHSEGSLWGSAVSDGRSTLHHTLYAHNRLRNPRTTGGAEVPAVLCLYNSIVYDWSEYSSHTGSERVHLNWLGNTYKPGPSTPADLVIHGFEFHGDQRARVFAQDNTIIGSDEATADNRKAVGFGQKLRKLSDAEKAAMIAVQPFGPLPHDLQRAADGFESTLASAGATLPARDAVDLRIINDARCGTGKIIGKETDLPEALRWPHYRSLPSPTDSDHDGIPDFWEKQFGLNDHDPADSARITASGYANIEHYFNNTDPGDGTAPIVFIAASVSRASAEQPGKWRLTRTGDTSKALTISYIISGDAVAGKDFEALPAATTFKAGEATSLVPLKASGPLTGKVVVATLAPATDYHVGCPSASLIVLGQ